MVAGKPIVLRSPHAVRPFQHVLDALSGYLQLAAALAREPRRFSGSWNFGPDGGSGGTVSEVAHGIARHWPRAVVEARIDSEAPREANVLRIASDKARSELGWAPRWGFSATVEATAAWYKAVLDGAEAAALTKAQILAHQESGADR